MNSSLEKLYQSKWAELCNAIQPILSNQLLETKPTNPLLLKIKDPEDFNKADIRLMIYGQETNSWGEVFNSNLNSALGVYDDFFNSDYCFSYGGQFWNGINRFLSILQAKYPGKKIRFLWNNIVKVGKFADKGFPPEYIYEVERKHFPVIAEELRIIQPNLILFLTGPNYDSVIQDKIGELKYEPIEPFSVREVSKLTIENVQFAFRTYHPNYLWRNNIDHFFESIVNQITL